MGDTGFTRGNLYFSIDSGATWEPKDGVGGKQQAYPWSLTVPDWALYATRSSEVNEVSNVMFARMFFKAPATSIKIKTIWNEDFKDPGLGWRLRAAVPVSGSCYTAGAIYATGSFTLNDGSEFLTGLPPGSLMSIECTAGPWTNNLGQSSYAFQITQNPIFTPYPYNGLNPLNTKGHLAGTGIDTPETLFWEWVDQYHIRYYFTGGNYVGYRLGDWTQGGFGGQSGGMGYIVRYATAEVLGNTRLQISSASLNNVCPNG
mgnify:CR=1 FL=1